MADDRFIVHLRHVTAANVQPTKFVPPGVVLVVDDTEANRYVAARLLAKAGFTVDVAATGADALRLATGEVELVVLDVNLPDLPGFEVARRLKADPATAHIPILHLSAERVSTADRTSGLHAGADGYLVQPIDEAELVAQVGSLLRLSRTERSLRQQNEALEAAAHEANRARTIAERSLALSVALSRASSPLEVAAAVVQHATGMFNAAGVVLVRTRDGEGELEILDAGDMPGEIQAAWRHFPRDAPVPLADVVRRGDPIFLESRDDWRRDYAHCMPIVEATTHHANAVVPLVVDGTVLGALGVAYAEPHAFATEERVMIQSTAQLAALAMERARLLEAERASRREAETANRAKSEFLAVMSHELRTPLNAIGGYAELMEMGIRGPVTDEQRSDLERIQRSQRHLLGLINGVLSYAQVEAGHVSYETVIVQVDELLATCEALIAPQARQRGIALEFAGCAPTVTARADAEKMRQVVLNLLSNAVKFTERGGRVHLACDEPAHELAPVVIRVTDTGLGIDAAQLESIFHPFVQLDARLTRTREGTGLGLAISRDLARGMGGDLVVESVRGTGSTFTLTLPRA